MAENRRKTGRGWLSLLAVALGLAIITWQLFAFVEVMDRHMLQARAMSRSPPVKAAEANTGRLNAGWKPAEQGLSRP